MRNLLARIERILLHQRLPANDPSAVDVRE